MTQLFKQFIYCNNNSNKNFPLNLQSNNLINGTAFSDYLPAIQLGIQAPPGTKFYINNGENPVIIGFTGLFELSLLENGSITSLTFDEQSIDQIQANDSAIIIIDIAYLGGGD